MRRRRRVAQGQAPTGRPRAVENSQSGRPASSSPPLGQPAAAIWEAATAKLILGGASNPRDLHDLSQLIGERDELTVSTSRDPRGGRSISTAIRRMPVLAPDALRTLPFGTAVLLLRTTRPILLDLQPDHQRADADAIAVSQRAPTTPIPAETP